MRTVLRLCRRLGLLAALTLAGCHPHAAETSGGTDGDTDVASGEKPWNIVVILTDDQRADSLWAMPIATERLVDPGVVFANARVSTPMCCPSRASMLSGGFYAKDVGVLTNEDPNGGAARFDMSADTLATRLQRAGYATGLIGKYLNAFEDVEPTVPSGWDSFTATYDDADYNDWYVLEGSSTTGDATGHSLHGDEYLTDFERDRAIEFERAAQEPFFLYVSTLAPHYPSTPAPEDADLYEGYTQRPASWNESDVSDKPAWLRDGVPPMTQQEQNLVDEGARNELRTLASVDRSIGAMLDALEARGVLDHTLVVLTSDNGKLWGEHRLTDKGVPYEPALRVPLVVLAPDGAPHVDDALVAENLDLPATLLRVAGDDTPTEGVDLMPLVRGEAGAAHDRLLLEGYSPDQEMWAGATDGRWKYVDWGEGADEELYDLEADPDELDNLARTPPEGSPLDDLRAWVADHRGLVVPVRDLPVATRGQPYSYAIPAVGGTPPYTWTAELLPDGLSLTSSGELVGTAGPSGPVQVVVTDSSASPWNGAPQRFAFYTMLAVAKPTSVSPDLVRDGPGRAHVHVHASAAATVRVRISAVPDFDIGLRVTSATRLVDGDVPLPPLKSGRTYFWDVEVDGAWRRDVRSFVAP